MIIPATANTKSTRFSTMKKTLIRSMRFTNTKTIALIVSAFFSIALHGENRYQSSFYRKNVIILVDQTPEVQNKSDKMNSIYQFLYKSFTEGSQFSGKDGHRIDLSIDPSKDQISVYGFGLTGGYQYTGFERNTFTGKYKQIHDKAYSGYSSKEDIYSEFKKGLIYKYGTLRQNQQDYKDINDFLKNTLGKACGVYGDSTQSRFMTTFSYYVYPLILDIIDRSKATEKYLIIVVTNYQSGLDDKGTSTDKQLLKDMLGERGKQGKEAKYYSYFESKLNSLKQPFYQIPILDIPFGDELKIDGFQLGLKSLQGVSAYITSNLNLKETGVGDTTYDLDQVNISFNKDKSIRVDSLIIQISEGDEVLYSDDLLHNSKYDELTHSYNIPEINYAELKKVFNERDTLNFQYQFFTSIIDEKGEGILPVVFTAERNYEITSETLRTLEEDKTFMAIILTTIIFTLILLAAALWYIYQKRGLKMQAKIKNLTIWSLSHDKFMEVKDKHASTFDCWYWREGDRSMNIPVSGRLHIEALAFAKRYPCKLEAWVEDIDDNEDFSFRPNVAPDAHGNSINQKQWFEIPMLSDNTFSFSVKAFIEDGIQPNFERDNILKLLVKVRCKTEIRGKEYYYNPEKEEYTFIVRPSITNTNIWLAFDPGTTGSCVAYGVATLPTANDDIFLTENEYDTVQEGTMKTHIFPSKVRFNHRSQRLFNNTNTFNVTELQEGESEDFLFGNQADMLWDAEGINCFQSIKKLLGYTDTYKIISNKGDTRSISGQEVAHLLVKGLYNHVEKYILNDDNVPEHVRRLFVQDDKFVPQRAIVAVPNNYTMVKVQDMVDTVKLTGKFQEVHFIYEAEAVMMMYFRQCWEFLPKKQDKLFIVFDMGGATINATAFSLSVTLGEKSGNKFIRRIDIKTESKIGYGVGGDDIDYTIIQIIYGIPSVNEYITTCGINQTIHQKEHKVELIKLARGLKLEIIDKYQATGDTPHLMNAQTLYSHIQIKLDSTGIKLNTTPSDDDINYLNGIIDTDALKNNELIIEYIFMNVIDAIENLLSSVTGFHDVELVMSGRSILFPGLKENVINAIQSKKYHCNVWDGFEQDGHINIEAVKTAVATGACWYAMYSDRIELHNNISTSSFGYIDMIDNKQKFIPVVKRNMRFENSKIEKDQNTFTPLAHVRFVQMLCPEDKYDETLRKDIKHKYNILDEARQGEIRTYAENIKIQVDDMGNFGYEIHRQGIDNPLTQDNNPYSRLSDAEIQTEIVNENSDAYIFAARSVEEVTPDLIRRFMTRIGSNEPTNNNSSNMNNQNRTGRGRRF